MNFNIGSLPWQGLRAKNKHEKYDKIKEKKTSTSFEQLCKGYPNEFLNLLNYCHQLKFEEKPDYSYIKKLMRDLFAQKCYETDYMYDWMLQKAV